MYFVCTFCLFPAGNSCQEESKPNRAKTVPKSPVICLTQQQTGRHLVKPHRWIVFFECPLHINNLPSSLFCLLQTHLHMEIFCSIFGGKQSQQLNTSYAHLFFSCIARDLTLMKANSSWWRVLSCTLEPLNHMGWLQDEEEAEVMKRRQQMRGTLPRVFLDREMCSSNCSWVSRVTICSAVSGFGKDHVGRMKDGWCWTEDHRGRLFDTPINRLVFPTARHTRGCTK